jgi:DNA topoisomerase IB
MPDATLIEDLPKDLHYVDDSQPGFTRKILRGKFAYFDTDGERIRDEAEIKRINALVIPPAYTDVWICADPAAICKPPGATPVAASSIAIIRAGARFATKTSIRA